MKTFLSAVFTVACIFAVSFLIFVAIQFPQEYVNRAHKTWNLIRSDKEPEKFSIRVEFEDGETQVWYVLFSNDNFYTWDVLYFVHDYRDSGGGIDIYTYIFDKQEAINIAKQYTSYEQCVQSNINAEARYDSIRSIHTEKTTIIR